MPSMNVNFQIKSMHNLSEHEKVRDIMKRRKFMMFTLEFCHVECGLFANFSWMVLTEPTTNDTSIKR